MSKLKKRFVRTFSLNRRNRWLCLLLAVYILSFLFVGTACSNGDSESPASSLSTSPSQTIGTTVLSPKPPGTLLSPEEIPSADLGDVGQTVTLSFPQLLKDSQYDDQDPLNPDRPEVMHIVYIEETSRLAVITETASSKSIACLTIYEPEWDSNEDLFANLTQEFSAKVVHRVNVDIVEGIHYLGGQINRDLKEDPTSAIDPLKYTETSQKKCIYGRFYYGKEEIGQPLTDDITAAFLAYDLSKLTTQNDVFIRIADRFGISHHLGL